MARHELKRKDVVEVMTPETPRQEVLAIPVLHEDADYIIVNKPAGVLSNGPGSVENLLRERRAEPDIRAVHRLDRDTTGCLLLARSEAAFQTAIPLFREHRISKTYHLIACGRMEEGDRTLTGDIDGQRAVTRIRTLDIGKLASHVVAKIETGRTHQIRKHMASIRRPILGDRQYAPEVSLPPQLMPDRQMLHASEVAFPHPVTGASVRVRAELPRDFSRCLKILGLT
jgi:23S rRNA pseudouridine1911/1915/1917 synthase